MKLFFSISHVLLRCTKPNVNFIIFQYRVKWLRSPIERKEKRELQMTHFSSCLMTQARGGALGSLPRNNRRCSPHRFALFRILNGEGVGMSAPLTFIAAHTHPTFGTSGPFSTAPRLAHLMSTTSSRKSLFSSEQLNLPTYGGKGGARSMSREKSCLP